jgi:hypothetical protein
MNFYFFTQNNFGHEYDWNNAKVIKNTKILWLTKFSEALIIRSYNK